MKCDKLKSLSVETFGDGKCEVYEAVEVDAAIAELKQKLEDTKATSYAESVDAGMENHGLKRALWLARAERAKEFRYKIKFAISSMNTKYNYSDADKWEKIELKCLKKEEEYK